MKITEVRNDFIDDLNLHHIDVWENEDENDSGRTAVVVDRDTGKVIWFDNRLRGNDMIKASVQEVLDEIEHDYKSGLLQIKNTLQLVECMDISSSILQRSITESYKTIDKLLKLNDWVVTDPDCNQMRKQLTETRFLFKEDRIVDPLTGKIGVFESDIDLDDYCWKDIVEACLSFGYSEQTILEWIAQGNQNALLAEHLFELET